MKKIFALLLMLALALSLFSCSGEVVENGDEVNPEEEVPAVDMNGFVSKILQHDVVEKPFYFMQDSTYSDLLNDRVSAIETRFNCDIQFEQQEPTGLRTYIQTNLAGGINVGEMVYMSGSNDQFPLSVGGYFYPLTDLNEIIDYEDASKYGPANLQEACMYQGVPYGVIPVKWPTKAQAGNVGVVFMINEEMVKQYNLVDPRDLYEQNKWTYEALEELTPSFNIVEGEKDIKTFFANKRSFIEGLMSSVGMKMVTKDDSGKVIAGFNTQNVIDVLNWGHKYLNDFSQNITLISTWTAHESLIAGDCTMALYETNQIPTIAKDMKDFGIVPFPISPYIDKDQQTFYTGTFDTLSIFANAENPEFDAYIIDRLFESFTGYETEEDMIGLYDKTMFFDKRDINLYMNFFKKIIYYYHSQSGHQFMTNIGEQLTSKTGTEIIGKIAKVNDKLIEEYMAANYEYVSTHMDSIENQE
ncbi:MAG: transporter substrate-binding protein [Clostridia bacterium]|nr:transporter substrate-binding protein [Clostridia bacterium]